MWIMSHRVFPSPGKRVEFYIGDILIATVSWERVSGERMTLLSIGYEDTYYASFGAALRVMHARLKGPGPEGSKVGQVFQTREPAQAVLSSTPTEAGEENSHAAGKREEPESRLEEHSDSEEGGPPA